MESIKELRDKLQKEKIELRKEFWGYKTFHRGPSIYITYPLLKTNIKPNHVTLIVLLLGILGVIFVFFDAFWLKILGLFLLYLNLIIDEVDGEIARYKKIFSLKGIYLDAINHLVFPALFLISLSVSVSSMTELNSNLVLIIGVLGGLSWTLLKSVGKLHFQIYTFKYKNQKEIFNLHQENQTGQENPVPEKSSMRKFLGFRYQIREFFIAIVFVSLILIFEQTSTLNPDTYPILSWFIVLYGSFLFLSLIEEIIKGALYAEKNVLSIDRNSSN